MATVGSLVVNLSANTSKFSKGMVRARASLTTFTQKAHATKTKILGLAGAFTTFAAGAGFSALVKSSFSAIDALAKTSDKLGIATKDLAGLRHAAELTGAGTRTLDMGLQRMTRRISEAAMGSGEAQGALEELGLDAEELSQMTPDAAFKRIADAFAGVEHQSDKVRLAFKLFDSEGVNLVNTLALGSRGLNQATADAANLGQAVSRFDAARIEQANDAFFRMGQSIKGVANTFAIALAPFITKTADAFTNATKQGSTFGDKLESALEGVLTIGAAVADVFRDISLRILQAKKSIMELATESGGLVGDVLKAAGFDIGPQVGIGEAIARAKIGQMEKEINELLLERTFGESAKKFMEELRLERAAAEAGQEMGEQVGQALTGKSGGGLFGITSAFGGGGIFGPLSGEIAKALAKKPPEDPGTVAAMQKGTSEAFSAIHRAMRQGQMQDKAVRQRDDIIGALEDLVALTEPPGTPLILNV